MAYNGALRSLMAKLSARKLWENPCHLFLKNQNSVLYEKKIICKLGKSEGNWESDVVTTSNMLIEVQGELTFVFVVV